MRRLIIATLVATLSLAALPAAAEEFQIINGSPAAEGEYPAMAALLNRDQQFQFCGGTLIDAEWVVTAAHCFYDSRTGGANVAPSALEIVVNSINYTQAGERLGVDQIVIHPNYDEFNTVNDIAMLHLATPSATAPNAVVPADGAGLYAPGRVATVVGYGTTRPDGTLPSEDLLKVDVPLVDDATCAQSYNNLVPDRHTCAGDPGPDEANPGPDTCQGDSGGPMFTDDGTGQSVLIGVTSFGGLCGVESAGVYTEVITYLGWLAGVIDGSIQPNDPDDPTTDPIPDDSSVPPVRIVAPGTTVSDPVSQANQISSVTFFEGEATYAVVARGGVFADALGGSSLAYGVAPLLFTGTDDSLGAPTIREIQRAVRQGSRVYVLGGTAAVPSSVDDQLRGIGMLPVRLAGPTREATAARVAEERIRLFDGALPQDTMIVTTGNNWPDAVTMGSVGSYWGVPILLTPPEGLHPETAEALRTSMPSTVLVAGGRAAVSDQAVALIEQITGAGSVIRLGGATRFETARAITEYNVAEYYGSSPPDFIVAVNLRRDTDAFAHVLAASMLTGRHGAVMAPVDGDGGTVAPQDVLESICGLDVPIIIAGGNDLITDFAAQEIQLASGGAGCDASQTIALGGVANSSITANLPIREYTFSGQAGQAVRIRLDATGFREEKLDPIVRLDGPGGVEIDVNDDSREGGLNSLLEVVLPTTGDYTIVADAFGETSGPFLLSLDPAPLTEVSGRLQAGGQEVVRVDALPAGTTVIVEHRRASSGQLDPVVAVLDGNGAQIAFDDDGGGFPNSRARFTAPGGPLTVVLTGFGETAGEYVAAVFTL